MWRTGLKTGLTMAVAAGLTGLGVISSVQAGEKDTKPPEIPDLRQEDRHAGGH
jgi:hypothetical protein